MSNKRRMVERNDISDKDSSSKELDLNGHLHTSKGHSRPLKNCLVDLTTDRREDTRLSSPLSKSAWSPASASKSVQRTSRVKERGRASKPDLKNSTPKSKDARHESAYQTQRHTFSEEVNKKRSITENRMSRDERQHEEEDIDLPPLSLEAFQGILRTVLAELRETHRALVKSNLKSARMSRNASKPEAFTQMGSPFVNIRSLNSNADTVGDVSKRRGRLDQSVAKTMKPIIERLSIPFITCSPTKTVVPPYNNYISTKRNILIEDDRQRSFLPYHGDDAWVDSDYADLESTIGRNRSNYHRLNAVDEQAKRFDHHVDEFLKNMGTDAEHVLRYLLDESNPTVPLDLPKELAPIWLNRESYIQQDYYDDSEDSEATDSQKQSFAKSRKPKVQWKKVLNSLPGPPNSRKVAAAGLACKAFMNVANFSLWHVIKNHPLVNQASSGKGRLENYVDGPRSHDVLCSKTRDSNQIDTYTDLGCLVCFAHECPGHGEFNDEEEEKNVRTRINAKPLSPSSEIGRTFSARDDATGPKLDASTIKDSLGMNEDKSISGNSLIAVSGSDCAFQDDELCSDDCFWLKSNRLRALSRFADEETELLHTFIPAYGQNRRGPCMLALAIDKPCVELFLQLLKIPIANIPTRVRARNHQAALNYRQAPKRTGDYWYQNSITWKHHERPPFKPCNHEGPCSSGKGCSCFDDEVLCEKTCMCSGNCTRRYQGCTCAAKGKICWGNDRCDCYQLHRECDPDLCRSCGAREVLDPANRYREEVAMKKCTNVYLQRGIPRRTLLGHSKLLASGGMSGWGLYMGEPLKNGDYIGEYVGEVVSREEGEQRGLIYDKRNMSYLFDLNETQTLDSTSVGNKFRYINHQADPYANCRAKILLCNTVHRIGMFACQNINVGDELLFDYGENFTSRFNLIKLDENAQPTIEKRRVAITKKTPTVDNENMAKKSGMTFGKARKNAMVSKATRVLELPPGIEGIESLGAGLGSDMQIIQSSKVSRKRRRSTLKDPLDTPAGEPLDDVMMWDLDGSDSYHEPTEDGDDGEEDADEEDADRELEVDEDGEGEEEVELEDEGEEVDSGETEEVEMSTSSAPRTTQRSTSYQRGWITRYANMAKRKESPARSPARGRGQGQDQSKRSRSSGSKSQSQSQIDEDGYETPQKRGWKTRYAAMAQRRAELEKEGKKARRRR